MISGNWEAGVHIKGFAASGNEIKGNVVGRDKNDAVLGNAAHGVYIEFAPQTVIGEPVTNNAPAPSTGNSNVISANLGDGIHISGSTAVRNLIRRNEIYENARLGINLFGEEQVRPQQDGVTPNDDDEPLTASFDPDGDDGPNDLMNFPVGVTAWYDPVPNKTYITGLLRTLSPEQATVDIYANTTVDPSGFGEGRFYLGSARPTAEGVFTLLLNGPLAPPLLPATALFLSATATDAALSTSEFSAVYGDPDGDGKVDSDGDALPDEWERNGLDFNGDSVIDLDLPGLGAKWDRKDVFVELDWMQGYMPAQISIDAVKSAFRRAGKQSRWKCHGHRTARQSSCIAGRRRSHTLFRGGRPV